jgi:pimeloyl-ACP methyl ester carboxylesterase
MTTWILLRGLTREQRHWGNFPALLRQQFPEARVVALELPGNGDLHTLTSPATIADMATYCHGEVARLGLPAPYHLLAMSMGAMVATAWADSHPEEIDACVLINTSFGAFSPVQQRLRPGAWPTLMRILLSRTPRRREALIFKLTSRSGAPPPQIIAEWVAIRESRPVRRGNAFRQLLAAVRFRAPVSPKVPTLVLTSAGDALVDSRCSMEIARRWRCAIERHPSAGHDLPLDDGPWVARTIREWLVDSPPSADSGALR